MSDTGTDATPAEEGSEKQEAAVNQQPDTPELGDAGKKAIAAERDARKAAEKQLADSQKALNAAMNQVKQFEDRDKTEDQRRQEALDAAKAAETAALDRASAAEQQLLRFQVGTDKGLSSTLVSRLVGETQEELEADADRLLAEIGSQAKPRKPQPDPTLGRGAAAGSTTADQFAAAMNSLL